MKKSKKQNNMIQNIGFDTEKLEAELDKRLKGLPINDALELNSKIFYFNFYIN